MKICRSAKEQHGCCRIQALCPRANFPYNTFQLLLKSFTRHLKIPFVRSRQIEMSTWLKSFWVPKDVRWKVLMAKLKIVDLSILIDNALDLIEKEKRPQWWVLAKSYRACKDSLGTKLGELMDLIDNIKVGDARVKVRMCSSRIYECFLGKFADAEGKRGGQFFTQRNILRVLVEMIESYKGRVYDQCYGSGDMFVQRERFIEEHGGKKENVSFFWPGIKSDSKETLQDIQYCSHFFLTSLPIVYF